MVKDAFYAKLEDVYGKYPAHNAKIVLGDFNAKVGWEGIFGSTARRQEAAITKAAKAFSAQLSDKLRRFPSILSDIGGLWAKISHSCNLFNFVMESVLRKSITMALFFRKVSSCLRTLTTSTS